MPTTDRGKRQPYKLPIAITQGGKEVPAGQTVQLFPDQIQRIDKAKAAADKAAKDAAAQSGETQANKEA